MKAFSILFVSMAFRGVLAVVMLFSWPQTAAAQGAPFCADLFRATSLSEKTEWLQKQFRMGDKNFHAADALAQKIVRSDPEEKTEWLDVIGSQYRRVLKKNPNPLAPWHIGGRRLLDRVLMKTERLDLVFENEVFDRESALQILKAFYQARQNQFNIRYSADQAFAIIQFIQKELQAVQPAGQPALKISLVGSFINGKADLKTSDIDFSISDPKMAAAISSWKKVLNEKLLEADSESNITLEIHSTPTDFYGKINPLAIEIRADGVDILVFPPGASTGEDFRAASPKRYPLF